MRDLERPSLVQYKQMWLRELWKSQEMGCNKVAEALEAEEVEGEVFEGSILEQWHNTPVLVMWEAWAHSVAMLP